MRRGKHIINWCIYYNRIFGDYNGKSILTSEIIKSEKYDDMTMLTTSTGSIYFVYDDERR